MPVAFLCDLDLNHVHMLFVDLYHVRMLFVDLHHADTCFLLIYTMLTCLHNVCMHQLTFPLLQDRPEIRLRVSVTFSMNVDNTSILIPTGVREE